MFCKRLLLKFFQLSYLSLLLIYFKFELLVLRFKLRSDGARISEFEFLLGKLLFKQSVLLRCLSQPLLKDHCGTVFGDKFFEEAERIESHGFVDERCRSAGGEG